MIPRTRVFGGLLLVVVALCVCATPAMAASSFEDFDGMTLSGYGVWSTCNYLSQNYYNIFPAYAASTDDFNLFALWSPPGGDFDLYLFDSAADLVTYSVSSTLFTDNGNQLDWIGYSGNSMPSGLYYAVPYAYSGQGTYMYAHIWKDNWYFY